MSCPSQKYNNSKISIDFMFYSRIGLHLNSIKRIKCSDGLNKRDQFGARSIDCRSNKEKGRLIILKLQNGSRL
jgi:hypothetical protein